jgi:hypothetical protein
MSADLAAGFDVIRRSFVLDVPIEKFGEEIGGTCPVAAADVEVYYWVAHAFTSD